MLSETSGFIPYIFLTGRIIINKEKLAVFMSSSEFKAYDFYQTYVN